ncbi:MAG: putative T7SS-secreted protein, partial [Catenulispora sp.]
MASVRCRTLEHGENLVARPTGWDVLGLDRDPTPGVVESVQALAKEFGDFAHDVQSAWQSLNGFGADTTALSWIGQSADSFKANFGPLPGRLRKLWISYSEASDALSAYAAALHSAQNRADGALRQGLDAEAELSRATGAADTAAADLKTAQSGADPKAAADAQASHDAAQKRLADVKGRLTALAATANQARDDLAAAAKECAKALHHASSDGIHNKHWWQHVGAALSQWGGKIAEIAGEIAPVLDVIALATAWIPGVDVITAGLAETDNLIALAGTGLEITGDAMQGHFEDALFGAGMLGLQFAGGRMLGKIGKDAEGGEAEALSGTEKAVTSGERSAEKDGLWQVSTEGRNKDFLSDEQRQEARRTALELGMPADKIIISDNMNTS